MFTTFFSYFTHYLFFAKTRQKLLFLAIGGLFLSSFALMTVQGIMGGLQKGLIERSKAYYGVAAVQVKDLEVGEEYLKRLAEVGARFHQEWEMELLLRHEGHVAPVVLHGMANFEQSPQFLKNKDRSGIVLGSELAGRLKARFFTSVQMITPLATNDLLGEVPRVVSEDVSDYVLSDVMEVDSSHAWVRLAAIQNLMRSRSWNRVRFFDAESAKRGWDILQEMRSHELKYQSWEEQHATLVWSLNLETMVMRLLFMSMALLVAIAITSGLAVFFTKIQVDLASFWILGAPQSVLFRLCLQFIVGVSAASCGLGVVCGLFVLQLLERFGHDLMPDIFVERSLPVDFGMADLSISFVIPFLISVLFSVFSFRTFKQENPHFLRLLRGLN